MIRLTAFIAALGLSTAVWAQAESPQTEGGAAAAAPGTSQQASSSANAEHELRKAYQREYAFLVAQKRELEQRLRSFRNEAQNEVSQLQQETDQLESQLLSLESTADRVNDQLSVARQSLESRTGDEGILDATLEQARASLKDAGFAPDEQPDKAVPERAQMRFDAAMDALAAFSTVRVEDGDFFLADGTEVSGKLVHFGQVASFGVSGQGSGALAPAGGGALKLWPDSSAADAEALAAGEQPNSLGLFLIENRNRAVADSGDKTVLEVIESGGAIAWIIVALGAVAALLALLRFIFLTRAGANTQTISEKVGDLVASGKPQEALEVCEKTGGATAKVVAAALRNLDRDPKHLDDIISETTLGESDYLDRYGTLLLVIAAISPLLGLLGTVTGMISTFDVITEFGTGDPKLLSGGISTALVTTELGLIVAIPTLLLGNVLSGWAERIKDGMEQAALNVVNKYRELGARA
ncbi:MotA/TolQ/ExbB proton channel family protein [Algiphilus sp.]|uniref:MotA/TolQ/ExbB proton channel family protein n=1 Tax=Algiphilus sp. TaxID=1872431 RepID=UPI0032EDD3E9